MLVEEEDGDTETRHAVSNSNQDNGHGIIVDIAPSRNGYLFTTITRESLSVWQTEPTILLATLVRSAQSLRSYGPSVSVLLRPDALVIVVQTENGYLITYSIASNFGGMVYQSHLGQTSRRQSTDAYRRPYTGPGHGPGSGAGISEVEIRFRMAIRIDAGISTALALERELVVATMTPSAVQCIRWTPDKSGTSHETELLKRMSWLAPNTGIVNMIHDRPMNLHVWTATDGRVYAVQRLSKSNGDGGTSSSLFKGYCFHQPVDEKSLGCITAINARFSLIAVGCLDSSIQIYTAKDYLGKVPYAYTVRLPMSSESSGRVVVLRYSPDGYCLFAGFEKGWAIWSVYGKLGANTFAADHALADTNNNDWLKGITRGFWMEAGSALMVLGTESDHICKVEMARSGYTGCFTMANISRALVQTSTTLLLYRGLDVADITAIPTDSPLWQVVQVPSTYLASQWPIRHSSISSDGRYLAVAGRRGLAHYSVTSGRWRTFDDPASENAFTVRGGMAWYQHMLVVATEANRSYQVRIRRRDNQ